MRIEYQYDTKTNSIINQLETQLNRLHYVLHITKQTKPYCISVQESFIELSNKLAKIKEVAIPESIRVVYEDCDDEFRSHIRNYIKLKEK